MGLSYLCHKFRGLWEQELCLMPLSVPSMLSCIWLLSAHFWVFFYWTCSSLLSQNPHFGEFLTNGFREDKASKFWLLNISYLRSDSSVPTKGIITFVRCIATILLSKSQEPVTFVSRKIIITEYIYNAVEIMNIIIHASVKLPFQGSWKIQT